MSYNPKSFSDYNEEYLRILLSTPGLNAAEARMALIRQRLDETGRKRKEMICDNCDGIKSDMHVCEPKHPIVGWEDLGGYMGVGH